MPASASFLATSQALVVASPEYVAFQAALAALSAAGEDGRQAAWNACYNDGQFGASPAYRLRKVVRDAVANTMFSSGTALGQSDAEAAYQLLAAQLVPESPAPSPVPVKSAVFTADDLALLRTTLEGLVAN